MNITNEIRARIFALYIGCEVVYPDGYTVKIVGITEFEGMIQVLKNDHTDWWNFDDAKLLLTPLDKITDEHRNELYSIISIDSFINDFTVNGFLESFSPSIITKDGNRFCAEFYYTALDFLRAKGYALPYMGIDLFTSGIAIDATEIKK